MSVAETLALVKQAYAAPDTGLQKAWTQSASPTTGLTFYDLEAPAKTLYPVITPLRNEIPRVNQQNAGIQANWRAITAINANNLSAGVSEGNRGGVIQTTVTEYLAAYRALGLEDYVTIEAELAAQGFDDVKARAAQGLLNSMMIYEEKTILGGNSGLALGTTPTPSVSDVATGGSLSPNTTYSVICVALTMEGLANANLTYGVQALVSRTNADNSTDQYGGGAARQSAAGTVTTANDGNTTHKVRASVTAVRGAFGYAWYVGSAGSERLEAITTINSVELSSLAGTGQLASALPLSDYSKNMLVFDGLLSMAAQSAMGAYYATMATGTAGTGTGLTADGAGGIQEFDTALQYLWDNLRLSPNEIWVSSQEINWIRKKILTGASNAAQRFVFAANQNGLMGGTVIKGYTNPFTMSTEGEFLPIRLHPNMPAGTVLMKTKKLPYPLSNVTNVMQMKMRRDYYQVEWPMRSRKYEYGVYADGVLQHFFPPSMAVITNIAAQ